MGGGGRSVNMKSISESKRLDRWFDGLSERSLELA